MGESDIRYLQRRADEEQQRADESTDRVAAAIHRRMATLYRDRIEAMIENPGFDPIVQPRQSA